MTNPLNYVVFKIDDFVISSSLCDGISDKLGNLYAMFCQTQANAVNIIDLKLCSEFVLLLKPIYGKGKRGAGSIDVS